MADYIKKRTHIIGHVRFLDAGPIARDLYDWGMLWSGQQETDGEIPMTALLVAAWGAGGKKNVVVAAKLVEVGLWERTDAGWRICKWSEQGNVTKALLVERRKAEREKKAEQRRLAALRLPGSHAPLLLPAHVPGCPPGTPLGTPPGSPAGVLNSTCIGSPISDLDLRRSEEPTSTRATLPPANDAVPAVPDWWAGACATAHQSCGVPVDDPIAKWAQYDASRLRLGWARNHRDAVSYLTKALKGEHERKPRSYRADTRQPLTGPEPEWLTRAKATGTDGSEPF